MRTFEVFTTEAISVSKYEGLITDAIKDGIAKGFAQMYRIKNKHPDIEKEFSKGYPKEFNILISDNFLPKFATIIGKAIENKLNDAMGSASFHDPVADLRFLRTRTGVDGYARNREIVVNRELLRELFDKIMENIYDSTYSSYNGEETIDGFYFIVKSMASGDMYTARHVMDRTDRLIDKLSTVVTHELVHVLQHKAQLDTGRLDTEYRSYLDTKKGEFHDLASDGVTSGEKFNRLYYASPQEIGAYAHDMALQIIRDYGLNVDYKNTDLSQTELPKIDLRDIVYAISLRTGDQFKERKTKKEEQVYRRYLKLVYLEVHRYIDNLRLTLPKA